MNELDFFTPQEIPPEILAYDGKIKSLGVGSPGKMGLLSLVLEKNSTGKTVITDQKSKVPLYAQRALYYETELPSMAYLQIISPSGGILQGDRYRMDISLKNNAMMHLSTQGATRIYKMNTNFATQSINISLDEGCYLEFIPDQIIPFTNSRYYQLLNLNVHENATMLYSEIITSGRVAMNESFDYDVCYLKTIAKNQKSKLRFVDTALLEPKKQKMTNLGLMGNKTVVGTVYLITKSDYVYEISREINSLIQNSKLIGRASIMPNDSGITVRIIDDNPSEIKNFVYEIVRLTRKKILHAPFTGIRKN